MQRITRTLAYAVALTSVAGVAQAQNKTGPDLNQDDGALTYKGITLYGVVDIGLQYENHGAPYSDYHPAGAENIVQKYSRRSVVGATPSNMGQSRVGLQGQESLGFGDLSAVFKIETFFNPQSGQISDAQKSMTQNNGVAVANQTTNLNSSVAGQAFQTAYLGLSQKQWGTITFGRQLTLVADGVNKYDPNYGSQAFSLIGMSGPYAGAGDTEDKRLDDSLKYYGTYMGFLHAGALYKFNQSYGAANSAWQANLGAEYAGLSIDAYFAKTYSAISNGPLSAAQVTTLPVGYTLDKSLSGTISDNTTGALMATYAMNPFKFFASYEHIEFKNPHDPLPVGFSDIGGYVEAYVNNAAFPHPKFYNVFWAGVRYEVVPHVELVGAGYYVKQNSYGAGATAGCTNNSAATCSGDLQAYSFDADWFLTKRFDVYAGAMYSMVHNGLSNGYVDQRWDINPTIGGRFKF